MIAKLGGGAPSHGVFEQIEFKKREHCKAIVGSR